MDQNISDNLPPASIPDHQLLRCIGRGSYGAVWLARNSMGIYRAVKIVYRKSFDDQRPFDRELSGIRKFEPVSRSHQGFVDVLHVGINQQEGYFYYVMELGDDRASGQNIDPDNYSPQTLDKQIAAHGKLSAEQCIQLGLALSQALFELHKQGLVHRDVKPANIIFVNGIPKLADIGLVAGVDEARSYVGTEGFIPPEGPGSPQADIYSLGKVLYETSTGKDRHDFPELPTLVGSLPDHSIFLELNEVILHACKNDLKQRYKSAWDMHADLIVLANGKSVRRLKSLERRLARFKRVTGITLLALAVLAVASYQIYRERRIVLDARQREIGASLANGNHAVESGNLLGALPYFAGASRQDPAHESEHRFRFNSTLIQCPKLTQLYFESGEILNAALCPDGSQIVTADFSGNPQMITMRAGGTEMRSFGHNSGPYGVDFSPDGKLVAASYADGSVAVWDAANLVEIWRQVQPSSVHRVRFSPDGLRIVTACDDGVARIYKARTGELENIKLVGHTQGLLFVAFSHDGKMIVTTSKDGTARLWDAITGKSIGKPLVHTTWVNGAGFSPDDKYLVTACSDARVRVWEVTNQTRVFLGFGHQSDVETAEYSPDGRWILTASLDGTARLWLADGLQPLTPNSILRHSAGVGDASFDRDGRRILTACVDGTVRIWDLAGCAVAPPPVLRIFSQDGTRFLATTNNVIEVGNASSGQLVSRIQLQDGVLEKAMLNRNGRFVISISTPHSRANETNQMLQVWDMDSGKAISSPVPVPIPLAGASISDDGRHLATFSGKTVQLWDVAGGIALKKTWEHGQQVGSVLFSPNGNLLAVLNGNQADVWNTSSGLAAYRPLTHPQGVTAYYAEFSPDGTWLATCCTDSELTRCYAQIWNALTGRPNGPRLMHGDGVLHVSFSPDGRRVATASEDSTALIWDVATGAKLTPALQHGDQIKTSTFNPSGQWILTSSSDNTARVWSAETGNPLTPPLWHANRLAGAQFLADGRRAVTTDQKGFTRVWDLPVNETLPLDDLQKLADLLSGNTPNPHGGGMASTRTESLGSLWDQLRRKYPSTFTTSTAEIEAWHQFQAEQSEADKQWSAAIFHLNRLLRLRPNDSSLLERIARANENLKMDE